MNKYLLTIELDAVHFDQLTDENTPFIRNLVQKSINCKLNSSLTFTSYCEAFTGLYPEETGIWTTYQFDPKNSSFNWIRPFMFLFKALDNTPLEGYVRKSIDLITHFGRIINEKRFLASVSSVPIELLPYLKISQDNWIYDENNKSMPTLFQALRKEKKRFCYIALPIIFDGKYQLSLRTDDENVVKFALSTLGKEDYAFYHLYFRGIDELSHKYGIDSKEVKNKLKKLDDYLKEIFLAFQKKYSKLELAIFSFHSMIPIRGYINILKELEKTDLVHIRDYIVFLDSTMARFWFKDEASKKEIIKLLKKIKDGKILLEEDLVRHKIRFKDQSKYGALIFLLNPGYIFYPNHFQKNKIIKAMHTYEATPELDGFFIYHNKDMYRNINLNKREIIDLFPTFLDILKIKHNNMKGKSIIKDINW